MLACKSRRLTIHLAVAVWLLIYIVSIANIQSLERPKETNMHAGFSTLVRLGWLVLLD